MIILFILGYLLFGIILAYCATWINRHTRFQLATNKDDESFMIVFCIIFSPIALLVIFILMLIHLFDKI